MSMLLVPPIVRPWLPPLAVDRNKYQAGQLLMMAGHPHQWGAGQLCASAAFRGGAGMVRWLWWEEPPPDEPWEVMRLSTISVQQVAAEIERSRAWAVGPGLSATDSSKQQVLTFLQQAAHLPGVVDATALSWMQELPSAPYPRIWTPHEGELRRLLPKEKGSREELALLAAKRFGVFLIAKGHPTYIFAPDGRSARFEGGDPGLATAGTGDVLTGLLGALLAQGGSPFEMCCLGVVLHGTAGSLAAQTLTSYSLTARDLLAYLPSAFRAVLTSSL